MKVKFFSDYADPASLLQRFKANYDVYDDMISFTVGEDYDYAVAFNRSDEKIKDYVKVITVIQEPSWSEAHQYREFLAYSNYLIVHDANLFERTWNVKMQGHVIESPAFMFYHDRVDHSFFDGKEHFNKSKKLSMIVSAAGYDWANYQKRLNLVSKILESDLDIDLFGRGFSLLDSRYKGPLQFKHTGLLPYEYSIAIENSNERNYISEKFTDCVLCNTVPIYNGAPNISDVYDEKYFRKLDLDSADIIQDIKKIIKEKAPGTEPNKKIYSERYNLYTKLKEIIFEIDPRRELSHRDRHSNQDPTS